VKDKNFGPYLVEIVGDEGETYPHVCYGWSAVDAVVALEQMFESWQDLDVINVRRLDEKAFTAFLRSQAGPKVARSAARERKKRAG
jgi:hypothetical protein